MAIDPISGPIPREQFRELINAPCGEAVKTIRKYDPQYGRAPGEKFSWEVRVIRGGADEGTATVMAANKKDAEEAADALSESDISWDYGYGEFEIVSIEPEKVKS